ncbi:hypothetical protein LIA77_10986 [Sarocladium implicatum]|nr:hypothetical protein LIA77_10986 [Sarocladium implicatum]
MRFTSQTGLSALATLFLATTTLAADCSKAIFLFKDVLQSDTESLKTVGFNTLILFRIGLLEGGDLVYYATGGAQEEVTVPVVVDGEYVGGDAMAEMIRGYKEGDTLIDRVEVSLISIGITFTEIRDLIARDGIGSDTPLYRNFKALKDAWDLDGVNNDDEGLYDVSSTVDFAIMLGDMGYKYSSAPYQNIPFWQESTAEINSRSPGLADKVFLQVYDGGANNDPNDWYEALGLKITPMQWVTNDAKPQFGHTPEEAREKFEAWNKSGALSGAGYWNDYDIERMGLSYVEYADVLNDLCAA